MTATTATDHLDLTVQAVAAARGALAAALAYRDDVIRDARASGVSASDLAARTGLSVPRIYQVLGDTT